MPKLFSNIAKFDINLTLKPVRLISIGRELANGNSWSNWSVFRFIFVFHSTSDANNLSDVEKNEYFNTQVKPILEQNCFQCHGGETEVEGGLHLTSRGKNP